MSRIVRIGERARQALARSARSAIPLSGFADAPYFSAAGELIWVGARLPAMHPRAVLLAEPRRGAGAVQFENLPAQGWAARLPLLDASGATRAVAGASALCRGLLAAEAPRGFGLMLAGRAPAFPLELAAGRVRDVARAYADDDPDVVMRASLELLGLGEGLTPSGDDLAGAALFGRRLVAPRRAAWEAVAEQLMREAGARSHAISAALFADLARGESFAPLHAIADGLAHDDADAALAAARELVAIGHSSGWDMFTGLVIGITGRSSP